MSDSKTADTTDTTNPTFDAAIFDMDGLLLESESLWRTAEVEAVTRLGLPLTNEDFDSTMGVRMRDVARIWYQRFPWEGPTPDEVAEQVIDRLIELLAGRQCLPGVLDAIQLCADEGMRLALCSSSDERIIDAVLSELGIGHRFELTHSAEHNEHGKPHPEPFLSTATKLGVDPRRCLVFEDSVTGCVSAKAAGMTVVAVPDRDARPNPAFGIADVVLPSLEHLGESTLSLLAQGIPVPTLSRPRFRLTIPVKDLPATRRFYGEILGCPEGRSGDTWVDFDLWGHQIVAQTIGEKVDAQADDGPIPIRHFGLLLHHSALDELITRLAAHDVPLIVEPSPQSEGPTQGNHQGPVQGNKRCVVHDPGGNVLSFESTSDDRHVFAMP